MVLIQRLDKSILEMVRLRSENHELKRLLLKTKKHAFNYRGMKRFKSEKCFVDYKEIEELLKESKKHRNSIINNKVKVKAINPKNIKTQVTDFQHLYSLHKKNEYRKTLKTITNLMKKSYIDQEEVEELIESTIDSIDGFIVNFDEEEVRSLIESFVYEELYPRLFTVSDDDEMKNEQIKEKIKILQNYIKPSMLGIEKKHINMKILSQAINGKVKRTE